jgi:UDP-N-acetylmuramoylalanine--D-glutamate ligase
VSILHAAFVDKEIAVIGLAATGLATARVLTQQGAHVTLYDAKSERELNAEHVAQMRAEGITLKLGTPTVGDADLVVPSPGVPAFSTVLKDAVARRLTIWSEIEVAYKLCTAPILAITGTNGKTTTTAMLGAICKGAGYETFIAGNIAEDEGRRLPLIEAAMQATEKSVIVAEISSFQLEWAYEFRPKVCAWLNLAEDHLDRYEKIEDYAYVKAKILQAQKPGDYAVLNRDDSIVVKFLGGPGRAMRLPFHGDKPLLDPALGLRPTDLKIPGKHNIANAVAASAMAMAYGVPPTKIAEGLRNFTGVAHRMEFVREVRGVHYINNSMCTNPAAVIASVEAIITPLIAIVGGVHKGGDLNAMAQSLAQHAKKVILIGQAAAVISESLTSIGYRAIQIANSLGDAVEEAVYDAKSGDTVMLVPGCSSFDQFTGFEHRGQVFRDAINAL